MKFKDLTFFSIVFFSGEIFAKDKPCNSPSVENGMIAEYYYTFSSHYFPMEIGKRLSFSCLAGYSTETGKQRGQSMCTAEGWSPTPKCFKKCSKPGLINGFFPDLKMLYKIQENMHYRCASGFKTPGGKDEETVQCLPTGWSSQPSCNKEFESCLTPDLYHGRYSTTQKVFNVNEKLQYECDDGYLTTGGKRMEETQCLSHGWTLIPQCSKLTCTALRIENGRFYPLKNTYEEGDVVQFFCHGNYSLTGSDLIQCYNFGWYPEPPTCEGRINRCPPPPLPPSAKKLLSSRKFQHGETVRVECELNFEIKGPEEIHCENGKWTTPPVCIESKARIGCDEPPLIEHGTASLEAKVYYSGDKVKYSCEDGYLMKGSKEIVCRKGRWTTPPDCVENNENCGPPPAINNGAFIDELLTSYPPGSSVEYRCTIYYLMDGNARVYCGQGNWSAHPTCLEPCSINTDYMDINNIERKWKHDEQSFFLHGDSVDFLCKPGYDLTPSSRPSELTVWCNRGTLNYPKCYRKESKGRCGPPPNIKFGNIIESLLTNYENGSSVKYSCFEHHFVKGSTTVYCLDGQWTSPPLCLEPCILSRDEMDRNNLQLRWSFDNRSYFFHGEYVTFICKSNSYPVTSSSPSGMRVRCDAGQLKYPKCALRSRT
ncbi:coagulation factor XIII B chain [Ornithorhynchus anatinus]|uniref:Coagulation factor XIII B chain n=1 Tax=Ornithorhynchus anatinus TaxID=9258 RepID=F7FRK4_ORNAN|nr:coagulation factor XIII B chain [Ornithorhynchus anatinus]